MNRIISFLSGVSLAALFFVTSADAQSEKRITADVPFEFTVGGISLPAGHYEFLDTGANFVQLVGASRRSLFLPSSSTQASGYQEKSTLKFAYIDGHYVLFQIWNELAAHGSEFPYDNTSRAVAKPSTPDGTVAVRR
jgi:hypothetical protein